MKVTHESSVEEYERLRKLQKPAPEMPMKPLRASPYSVDGRSVVALVRADNRKDGMKEGIRLLGGLGLLFSGVTGETVIKPNCNTDDPFPRNTDPETVGIIAECLIMMGIPAKRIVVGDMSGRYRGLPTRHTMTNVGIVELVDELGIQTAYFEEEDWVTVKHPLARTWPAGMRIPRRIYEADRVILTPIMRPHEDATFSMCMKLAVGLMDVAGREWLHNGEAFYQKLAEFNLAFSADLSIVDGMKCYVDSGPQFKKMAEPEVLIMGSNRVATDAVAVAVMKQLGAHGIADKPVMENEQFTFAERLGLGKPAFSNMVFRHSDLTDSRDFDQIVSMIREELTPS